ncbi:MAG: Asp-tRNA(Asn)/Glu-tRNA(Gln) amidotransferase subunit GatB [Clostridia bacterium]|nr:Asp-tRNA(Asn)/Glu-tRNA(Gln) amidotransferase subunit GatB [Clostridia bacterium]
MKYELVSGLETHVELSTATKIFCSCTTAFGGAPNTHCCPVCTGMPGALPILNQKVVEYAIRAGLATHCTINEITHMDRKNYCYPDLPKAYQISQFDEPVCEHGYVELDSGKKIGITRIHIEEDAGKLVHERGFTFVDYNRGGVPLIEIVSEPDISSPEEAKEYLEKLQLIMRYIGVSDCKMQEGSMRADVNISLRPVGSKTLGTRTEIKNMSSPSFIVKAMQYEYERQAELLDRGEEIEQATLRYNESENTTSKMRGKEDAQDYRYFPEPDILTVHIPKEKIEEVKASLPELPTDKFRRYVRELGLSESTAKLIYPYRNVARYYETVLSKGVSPRTSANLIVGTVYATLKTEEEKEAFSIAVPEAELALLVSYVDSGKLQASKAGSILLQMLESGKPVSAYVREEDLKGLSDEELKKLCEGAIAANPKAVEDFKAGKQKAIGSLFGFLMKQSRGKADVKKAEVILRELLK